MGAPARALFGRVFAGDWTANTFVMLVTLVALLGAGYAATTANLLVGAAAVGLVAGILLTASPFAVLLLLLVLGLVIAGLAQLYLPSVQEIRWLAVPLALILAGHALLARLAVRNGPAAPIGLPPVLWWAVAVVLVVLMTVLVNVPDPLQLVRGLKGYFQVWGLMIGLALLRWPDGLMRRGLPLFLLAVALLQLPFVAHETMVLAPHREAQALKHVVPEDVISGTFGAQAEGGGANSMLAVYMMVMLGGLVSLWQQRLLSGGRLAVLGLTLLLPLFLNEAKVSLVYMAVIFLVLFGRDLIAQPARFFAVGTLAGLLLVALLTTYAITIRNPRVHGLTDLVTESYRANITEDFEANGTFTRAGALRYWARQHFPGNLSGALLGHGVYESRTANSGATMLWDEVDKSLGVKNTAISALLWDAGIVVLLAVFALMGSVYATARRLARHYRDDPWLAALFRGAQTAAAIFFVSLWFKSYFTYQLAYQTTFALLVGWLAYWEVQRATPLPGDGGAAHETDAGRPAAGRE